MTQSIAQPKRAANPAPKQARKDEILAAARRILIEEGHHRLTLRNVAQNVGIKLASLQYHFSNKNALITALIDTENDSYQSLMESLLGVAEASADDQAVASIMDRLFEEYQDERALKFHEQLWALSIRDPEMMKQYLQGYEDVWDSAEATIGRFDPASTKAERRTRAALIIALVDGLDTFLTAEPLRRRLPNTMQESVSELIRAIARGTLG